MYNNVTAHTPCFRCGWKFGGFHICLDLPKSVMREVVGGRTKKAVMHSSDDYVGNRLEKTQIEEEVIELYNEGGHSMKDLAVELELSHYIVCKILYKAADDGLVTIAKRGGVKRKKTRKVIR